MVVVLEKVDEGLRREINPLILRHFGRIATVWKHKAVLHRELRLFPEIGCKGPIVAVGFAGRDDVSDVMEVIVPFRCKGLDSSAAVPLERLTRLR
ncbi:hypothetical protein AJ87_37780 [Rhizobium yanglingense]|nr:hypothetical protein AJ87_37780 [Rhizobium yanglingense]